MLIAVGALLSLLLGCAVLAVIQLGLIVLHLGELKAHTMIQTDILNEIRQGRAHEHC